MSFQVPVTLHFVPGKAPFEILPDTQIRLLQYGWSKVSFTIQGPTERPLRSAADFLITYTLEGKPGATDATASNDVIAALKNTSLFQLKVGNIAVALGKIPTTVAGKVGEAAGAAASGAVKKAGVGLSVGITIAGIVALGVVVAVGVIAAKRG